MGGGGGCFFLQIHYEGLRGGVFGGRRRGKGVSFFRQTFFSLLNGQEGGARVFFLHMLKGGRKGGVVGRTLPVIGADNCRKVVGFLGWRASRVGVV